MLLIYKITFSFRKEQKKGKKAKFMPEKKLQLVNFGLHSYKIQVNDLRY